MAQIANPGNKGAKTMAGQGVVHHEQEFRRNRSRRYRVLPAEIKAEIIKLYNEGLPVSEIVARLGVCRGIVSKNCPPTRRGKYKRWSNDKTVAACTMLMHGKTYEFIASKFGCTANAVRIAVCRHRKQIKADPTKNLVASVLTKAIKVGGLTVTEAIKAARKADIFRGLV